MTIWNKYEYKFVGFGGVDNCSKCDDFTHVDEYDRSDGAVTMFCRSCADTCTRLEPTKITCQQGHKYSKDESTGLGCPECLSNYLENGGSLD